MPGILVLLTLLVFLLRVAVLAEICFEDFPIECSCDDINLVIKCPWRQLEAEWDMKKSFDSISKNLEDDGFIFEKLELDGRFLYGSGQPIFANITGKLKFRSISINLDNDKFQSIHPKSFPATVGVTRHLAISHSKYNGDIYFLIREFFNLKSLTLSDVYLQVLPERTFRGMKKLEVLNLENTGIEGISSAAFADATSLLELNLNSNILFNSQVNKDAFVGISTKAAVSIAGNTFLTHFPEETFKKFLDRTEANLTVGNLPGVDENIAFYCDVRADWICANAETYKKKIFGFRCREDEFEDVFEYCQSLLIDEDEDEDEDVDFVEPGRNSCDSVVGNLFLLYLAIYTIICQHCHK